MTQRKKGSLRRMGKHRASPMRKTFDVLSEEEKVLLLKKELYKLIDDGMNQRDGIATIKSRIGPDNLWRYMPSDLQDLYLGKLFKQCVNEKELMPEFKPLDKHDLSRRPRSRVANLTNEDFIRQFNRELLAKKHIQQKQREELIRLFNKGQKRPTQIWSLDEQEARNNFLAAINLLANNPADERAHEWIAEYRDLIDR
jgi:hypothetical protein